MDWLSKYGGRSLVKKAKTNLEKGLNIPEDMAELREIRKIIIHHSGFAAGNSDVFRWYHRVVNGWSDIGYHFVIGNGKGGYSVEGGIELGRYLCFQGAHIRGHNHDSVGICLIGNFKTNPPSQLMTNVLNDLLFRLCLEYALDEKSIFGHRDFNPQKICPGAKVDIEILRLNIGRRLNSITSEDEEMAKKVATLLEEEKCIL